MKIPKEDLLKIIEEISTNDEIELSDIPIIDLYMDQITTLFDEKLKNQKRNTDDKILTKTMINNYAKDKLLIPPKNKKYGKSHIILLSLIYNLKQSLSINDISLLLKQFITNDEASINLDNFYSTFLNMKKKENITFKDDILQKYDFIKDEIKDLNLQENNLGELVLIVLMLINESNMKKRMAEKIIDNFFQIKPDKKENL